MNALAFGNEIGGSLGRGYSVSSVVEVELVSVFAEEDKNISNLKSEKPILIN